MSDDREAQLPTFGRRKVAPRVGIIDAKRHIRLFLAEALEELGFIPTEYAAETDVASAAGLALLDLAVLGFSAGGPAVASALHRLAARNFPGRVLLIGASGMPALTAAHELGTRLGLVMLPALAAPYRAEDLKERVSPLRIAGAPPSPPVDVEEALSQEWLELWYQAKIDVRALTVRGAEALIRMRHPAWGIVPPACFIPGEGDPHFRALSEFVVARAMQDWLYFVTDAVPVEIAINLPAAILADAELVQRMCALLPHHPAFGGLTVEVNGAELIQDIPRLQVIARQLRFYNIGISIDDLGVEWRALAALEDFPFVEIKVDRQFVSGCATDRLKRAMCQTIVDLARRLDVRTVAEGVETQADFNVVREIGFDLVQGYLFCKPMERRKFARTMLTRRKAVS
jgi:EAL domain-containing protein (putative c-di-GMP-specific phosphodiesterase class I)